MHAPTDRLVLLVTDDANCSRTVTEALSPVFRVQILERPRPMIARLGGGGVAAVLIDPRAVGEELGTIMDQAVSVAPTVRLVLLTNAPPADYPQILCVPRDRWSTELTSTLEESTSVPSGRLPKPTGDGEVLCFLGAKGGVGTTTVSLSVAHELANSRTVILTETEGDFGGLREYLAPPRVSENSRLWQSRSHRNLRVAFAPNQPTSARQVLQLAERGDTVVADLSARVTPSTRTLIENADSLALVVEREPVSCNAAYALVQNVLATAAPKRMGLIVVNKAPLSAPLPILDIEARLGLDIWAVIPPAADLCAAANKQHTPVIAYDVESSMARALTSLAAALRAATPSASSF